jgi:hypothetical protein
MSGENIRRSFKLSLQELRMRILIPLFSPPTGTWGGLTWVLAISEAARASGH